MTEPTPTSLAERAHQRLRKLATGNGLEPAAIDLIEVQEQVFILKGRMDVTPSCQAVSVTYPGGPKNKAAKILGTPGALQQAVLQHQQEFRKNPDWIAQAADEIKTAPGEGWGLENAKVTLPQKSAIFAASLLCPSCQGGKTLTCQQCNGTGQVLCRQCQGVGRELCYYCGGRGEDPQQPGQRCHTCEGTRYALCRFCRGHKYLPCPTCNGRRATPCAACQATGKMTQEITVDCAAETHFTLQAEGLPSGLRRGLERIGIGNLGKGHADIKAVPVTEQELEHLREGAPIPILTYSAALPYAEMRMRFGAKKAVVSAVGKRCALNGVPDFLDAPLQPWRDKLRLAAAGKGKLEEASEARALKEILALCVAGKGRIEEARRLYPFGLSAEALNGILSDTQLALNKTTLKSRTGGAVGCALASAVAFYMWFEQGFGIGLTMGWNRFASAAADFGVLVLALSVSWAVANFSARMALQKRFPQMSHALRQKIGKTGMTMLGCIIVAWIGALLLAPVRPWWLALLLR